MSSERKDEFLSWRSRLDSPEGVPGQGLDDREHTWQRLSERLNRKPRRRWPVYGIIAACLLLAIFPASHFFRNGKKTPADGGERQASQAAVRQRSQPAVRQDRQNGVQQGSGEVAGQTSREEVLTLSADRTTGLGIPAKRTGLKTAAATANRKVIHPAAKDRIAPALVSLITDSLPGLKAPPAPLVSQLPPPVVQKKWKVVDWNELGTAPIAPYRMASGQREPYFRISLGRMGAPGVQASDGQPTDQGGIRIKISSSN